MIEVLAVIRTERDAISGRLMSEVLIERLMDGDRERQTTCRETRYDETGRALFEWRPVACDAARQMIDEAERCGCFARGGA